MLKFFYSTQTCSTAVRIALEEAGLEYEGVEVSWQRKLNLDALAAVNPLGQVPALAEEGRVLTQTPAILEYVADRARTKHLLSAVGTWGRTEASVWLAYLAADVQKSFGLLGATRWMKSDAAKQELSEVGHAEIRKHIARIDQSLTGKEYLVAEHFTVVDIYCLVLLGWTHWAGISLDGFQNLRPYLQRMVERPSVRKVLEAEELLQTPPFQRA